MDSIITRIKKLEQKKNITDTPTPIEAIKIQEALTLPQYLGDDKESKELKIAYKKALDEWKKRMKHNWEPYTKQLLKNRKEKFNPASHTVNQIKHLENK